MIYMTTAGTTARMVRRVERAVERAQARLTAARAAGWQYGEARTESLLSEVERLGRELAAARGDVDPFTAVAS